MGFDTIEINLVLLKICKILMKSWKKKLNSYKLEEVPWCWNRVIKLIWPNWKSMLFFLSQADPIIMPVVPPQFFLPTIFYSSCTWHQFSLNLHILLSSIFNNSELGTAQPQLVSLFPLWTNIFITFLPSSAKPKLNLAGLRLSLIFAFSNRRPPAGIVVEKN